MLRFAPYLDRLPLPAMIAHQDGRILFVNKEWEDQTGWGRDEVVGTPYIRLVHPDDIPQTAAEHVMLNERGSGGSEDTRFVNRYRCKGGGYVAFSWKSLEWSERGMTLAIAEQVSPDDHSED